MAEASQLSASAALRAWLSTPADTAKLSGVIAAAGGQPIDASAIAKLPAAAIAVWRAGTAPHLDGLRPMVRQAAIVCGLARPLGLALSSEESRELETLPFAVGVSGTEVIVELQPGGTGTRFGQPFLHQWVAGIHADAMVIDCSRLNHVNSVLIAWMLQVVQSAKPVPVRIRAAKPQVATQLKQLRLDHLMIIE